MKGIVRLVKLIVFIAVNQLMAQEQHDKVQAFLPENHPAENVFKVVNPDLNLSPYTGMTKQHWKDAALYLLEGAFSYINSMDDPMKFPKLPGKSYPHDAGRVPTEKLEGLCRTLFIAAPLLMDNPELELNNIKVADYYRYQIAKLVDTSSASFIPHRSKNGGPSQNLVEFGALGISLFIAPDALWHPLAPAVKDALAATMISYGDGPTVPSNWKFFNIFVLSFFEEQGYSVNEKLLEEYLEKSLEHYRGDGWYNDNPAYDYYSMWAFQMYGMLWSEFYGKEHYPEIVAKFNDNFRDLKGNYSKMFSKDGEMIMWGRSISYRMGAIAPFPLMGFLNDPTINYGWMRRISSGVLLQFLENPEFMQDGVPTLGFYGHFEPAVQVYSCRGSVYWMGKAFLGLLIPDDNPFWNEKENEGLWDAFEKDKVYNDFQEASNILITDYPLIGASEIRAWCHEKVADDWQGFRSTENYNRLSYNSAFPWQADGENGEVAMNYVIKNKKQAWEALRLFDFKKYQNGIYYRDAVLETDEKVQLKLADIPLANGILRVDKNTSKVGISLRLGHYALPELEDVIREETRTIKGNTIQIIDNGKYQLAMIPLEKWGSVEAVAATGLNPLSNESKVLNVAADMNPESNSSIMVTLMLWKKSGEKWSKKDLTPVKKITIKKDESGVDIILRNGQRYTITYD